MTDDSMLGQLAEEFTRKVREGKLPDVEEYASQYPELAGRIRELFPTLMLLEGMAATSDSATPEALPSGLAAGSVFGQYRIEREIGRGGMGIVYEATHLLLEKRVALKVLLVRTPADAGHLERFFREARTAAGLHHTNIVPVFDVGQVAGTPYFAMQYIEGRGLDQVLRLMQSAKGHGYSAELSSDCTSDRTSDAPAPLSSEVSPFPRKETKTAQSRADSSGRSRAGLPARSDDYFHWVAGIGIQAANGLAYAHERKVVHRDIKPSNLILDKQGVLWIADFGLARRIEDPAMTQSGAMLGTPRYMSPEQAEAAKRPVDQRSDIYSLDATLYELLTCRPVFEGKTPQDVLSQILTREPVAPRRLNPEIPADLATIVMKAMAKRPEDRYQSAKDFADDLQRWLKLEPIMARPIGPVGRTIRWCRRNPKLAAVTAAAAAIILALSGIYYSSLIKENANTHRALQRETEAHQKTDAALVQAQAARKQAEISEQQANAARNLAENLQNLAETERDAAQVQRREALYQSYRSNLLAADSSLQAGEIEVAKELLALCDPALRGWEWRYLHRTVDTSIATSDSLGRDVGDVAFSAGSDAVLARIYQVFPGGGRGVGGAVPSRRPEFWVAKFLPERPASVMRAASGVRIISISPDGSRALSADWNLSDTGTQCAAQGPQAPALIMCQPGPVRPAVVGSAPRTLTSEERDRLIVTDTTSGQVIATLRHPNMGVWTGAASALRGSERLLPGPSSVVKYANGPPIAALSGQGLDAIGGAFSRDGSRLATWSWDNTIYLWDLQSQALLTTLRGHVVGVRSVAFAPDMSRAASCSFDGTVRLWLIRSGEEAKRFRVSGAATVAFSPDGSRIAVGTDSGVIQIWDVQGSRMISTFTGHASPVSSVAFSPDSARLVSAGTDDRIVRLWDIASATQLMTFVGHVGGVSSVAFSPNGQRIATGSKDGTVRVWDARSPAAVLRGHSDTIIAVGLTSGGKGAMTAAMDRTLRVWDTTRPDAIRVIEFDPEQRAYNRHSLAISQDKFRLAVPYLVPGSSDTAGKVVSRIIDIESGNTVLTVDHRDNGTVTQIGMTADAARLAAVSRNSTGGAVQLWDTASGRSIAAWTIDGSWPLGCPLAISADGARIAVAVDARPPSEPSPLKSAILIFAAESSRVLMTIPITGSLADAPGFMPDGTRVVFADGATVHVWDLRFRKEVATLKGHDGSVRAIVVSPDGSRIVTGGSDRTVRIWDAARYELLLTLRLP